MRLSEDEIFRFLHGQTLHAFDPQTLERVATVEYRNDGTCLAYMADDTSDDGLYGVEGNFYWTQYRNFRNGEKNRFSLEFIDAETAQAVFESGKLAFIQSTKSDISHDTSK